MRARSEIPRCFFHCGHPNIVNLIAESTGSPNKNASGASKDISDRVPSWVQTVGTAIWIVDREGVIRYLNKRAETLIGCPAAECKGRPCYEIISGVDADGEPFCNPECPALALVERNRAIPPKKLRIACSEHGDHWVQVTFIAVSAPDRTDPWLVHCAVEIDRERRMEEYLAKVASRSGGEEQDKSSAPQQLTKREQEVLRLLAEDMNLHEIAEALHVSYTTVRNHVQHILAKLDAHSIVEAVARDFFEHD